MNTILATVILFLGTLFVSVFGVHEDTKISSPATFSSYATVTAEVLKVIDGDTIEVQINDSNEIVRVRYIGIDTPEPYREGSPECGSAASTKANQALVQSREISLVPGQELFDSYDRLLAYVYVDTLFVNESLVREGFARTMTIAPNDDFSPKFKQIERDAQRERKGNWGACR